MTREPPRWKLPVLPNEFVEPSGIVRVRPTAESIELPPGIAVPNPVLAIAKPPSFEDQLYAYATAKELVSIVVDEGLGLLIDLRPLTADDVLALIRDVPFEPAMRFLAAVQKTLWFRVRNSDLHFGLMRELYGDTLAAAGAIFAQREARRALFSEQQVFALQRLVVLHARDEPTDDWTAEESVRLRFALLWTPDTILDPDLQIDEQEGMLDLADATTKTRWIEISMAGS